MTPDEYGKALMKSIEATYGGGPISGVLKLDFGSITMPAIYAQHGSLAVMAIGNKHALFMLREAEDLRRAWDAYWEKMEGPHP